MAPVLVEKPNDKLSGRLAFTVTKFVTKKDIIDKKVLDIGCGFGWFEYWALKNKVRSIYAMEINAAKLEAIKNIQSRRLQLVVGNALKIPFPANTFDTIVSWEVIEHIPKGTEEKMFQEICRVLKPRGTFYLSTPFSHWLSKFLDPAWWLIGHRHYDLATIFKFAEKNGLSLHRYRLKGKLWELLTVINLYFSKWFLRRSIVASKFFARHRNREYRRSDGYALLFVKLQKEKS